MGWFQYHQLSTLQQNMNKTANHTNHHFSCWATLYHGYIVPLLPAKREGVLAETTAMTRKQNDGIIECAETRWWFRPIWKICSSNWIISMDRGENKNTWNHHLDKCMEEKQQSYCWWKTSFTTANVENLDKSWWLSASTGVWFLPKAVYTFGGKLWRTT